MSEFAIPAGLTRQALGDNRYEMGRSAATWTAALADGFLPVPPMVALFPVKLILGFILLLICLLVFHMGWWSLPTAYIGQAIIVTLISHYMLDKVLKYGFGI